MLAASTASALPSSNARARCSRSPAPPEAITGTPTASDAAHVPDLAHAAADGERDEDARGDGLDDMQQDVALVGARGDVEKAELVRAFAVVARGDLHRITGVAQADEVHALHHPAGGDVQAGDDAFRQRHAQALPTALSAAACALFNSSLPS